MAPGMCRVEYSRSPHVTSSILKRQSRIAKAGSVKWRASVSVSMSVVKAMTRTIPVGAPGLPLATRTYRTLMAGSAELQKLTGIAGRFGAFVAERHPPALAGALDALEAVTRG